MAQLNDRDARFADIQESYKTVKDYVKELHENSLNQEEKGLSPNTSPKVVISLLGLPGAGKTTQIKEIQSVTDAAVFHMGKFAKSQGLTEEDNEKKRNGQLLAGRDEAFLEHALSSNDRFIILDGYPRSPEQAKLLVETMNNTGADFTVLHLQLGEEDIKTSMGRQVNRDLQLGK